MNVTWVVGILLVVGGIIVGVLIAPKAARYEAAFVSEFHALVAQGALDESHVKAWYDLLVRKLSAEAQKAELEAKAAEARFKNLFGTASTPQSDGVVVATVETPKAEQATVGTAVGPAVG